MIPLNTRMKQVNIICNILKDSYLQIFNNHITEIEDAVKEEDVEAAWYRMRQDVEQYVKMCDVSQ